MVAIVERDRRLARRLVTALEARGCRVRVAHGYAQGLRLLIDERPDALWVSESLQRASGGDLLAAVERDERFAAVPALVRVSGNDSVFARALRRGGLHTIAAPVDVERAARTLTKMASGEAKRRIEAAAAPAAGARADDGSER